MPMTEGSRGIKLPSKSVTDSYRKDYERGCKRLDLLTITEREYLHKMWDPCMHGDNFVCV